VNADSHLIFEAFKNRVVKKNDDEEGDLMTHMKEKGMIPKDARVTLPAHKTEEEEKDSFDMHVDQLKNTSTEELIEDLKDLYRIVADEKNVGDYSYDSANLDIEIIHDILKSRGMDYQKDLAPIWNKIDDEVNGSEENAEQRLDLKCWKGYHKQGTKMKGGVRVNNCVKSENAEDMSKSPFHYDPSHGLMQAANQINDILKSSYNDEATPEHIEKMALRIVGPQSEYGDYHEFNLALRGVKALLYRYVAVQMN